METLSTLGSAFGLAFLSGIRLYAVVFLVGLSVRLGWLTLPPSLSGLSVFASTIVLIVSAILLVAEFLSDKIAWFDSIWDTIHTFIRPIGGIIVGTSAVSQFGGAGEVAVALACGGLSLSAHSAKAGTRMVINQSPEPLSNVLVSFLEDVLVLVSVWLFLKHPLIGLGILLIILLILAWILPKLIRLLCMQARMLFGLLASIDVQPDKPEADSVLEALPVEYRECIRTKNLLETNGLFASVYSGKGCPPGKYFRGLLLSDDKGMTFVCRKWLKLRHFTLTKSEPAEVYFAGGLLLSRLFIKSTSKTFRMYVTKDEQGRVTRIVNSLQSGRLVE